MFLKKLTILNYKNLKEAELEFSDKINCFVGENGSGKSNVIDSIYYCSFCKSHISLTDRQAVNFESDFFMIDGLFQKNGLSIENIVSSFTKSKGKKIKRNDKQYDRLSEHIGVVPTILVSPYDSALINDEAEQRRKFLNIIISQTDKDYLQALITYNGLLSERNALLKRVGCEGFSELLEVIDMRFCHTATLLHRKRSEFLASFSEIVSQNYSKIAQSSESVSISYSSKLNDKTMEQLLQENYEKDKIMGYTTSGIHRDDVVMKIEGNPIRKYGSWGQQKSFLVALKLSEFDMIFDRCGLKPILLLDDIFDKLDLSRVTALLELVTDKKYGQIFITDANKVRIEQILDNLKSPYKLFTVQGGEVVDVVCGETNFVLSQDISNE